MILPQVESKVQAAKKKWAHLDENELRKVFSLDYSHKETKHDINSLFEKFPEFKRELIYEAATGQAKFGKDSLASATHLCVISDDATEISLYDFRRDNNGKFLDEKGEAYFNKLCDMTKVCVRMKTYQGAYRSCLALCVS